jgi:hypothetical protein
MVHMYMVLNVHVIYGYSFCLCVFACVVCVHMGERGGQFLILYLPDSCFFIV